MASRRHGESALDFNTIKDVESNGNDGTSQQLTSEDYKHLMKGKMRSVAFYALGAWLAVTIMAAILKFQLTLCPEDALKAYSDPVQSTCKCDCWDGRFKGCYGRYISANRVEYREVYFNLTFDAYKIFLLVAAFIISFAALIKEVCTLVFIKRNNVQWSMLIATLCTVEPNIYGFWAFFNYLNDGWKYLSNTQFFFSVTELVNTIVLLGLSDKSWAITPSTQVPLLFIPITISSVHISITFNNYLRNYDDISLFLRDSALLGTDFAVVIICAWRVWELVRFNSTVQWTRTARYAAIGYFVALIFFYKILDAAY